MKKVIISILLLMTSFVYGQTSEELDIIKEINQIRTNPKSYIPKVEEYIKSQEYFIELYKNGQLKTTSTSGTMAKNNSMTNKKVKSGMTVLNGKIVAAKDLIRVLDTLTPMDSLTFDSTMYPITVSHGEYLKSVNQTGHYGPNGESVFDRFPFNKFGTTSENCGTGIIGLMVDYGIPGYGHRYNILNPKWSYISIYVIKEHPKYGDKYMVQNFRD